MMGLEIWIVGEFGLWESSIQFAHSLSTRRSTHAADAVAQIYRNQTPRNTSYILNIYISGVWPQIHILTLVMLHIHTYPCIHSTHMYQASHPRKRDKVLRLVEIVCWVIAILWAVS